MELRDEEVTRIERTEKEFDSMVERAAKENGDDLGRGAANAAEKRYRTLQERREAQARERYAREWMDYFQRQRRAHLDLALDYRRRARELRGLGPEAA